MYSLVFSGLNTFLLFYIWLSEFEVRTLYDKGSSNYFLCRPFIFKIQLLQYHLPFGTVLRSTQAKWNHSISH